MTLKAIGFAWDHARPTAGQPARQGPSIWPEWGRFNPERLASSDTMSCRAGMFGTDAPSGPGAKRAVGIDPGSQRSEKLRPNTATPCAATIPAVQRQAAD